MASNDRDAKSLGSGGEAAEGVHSLQQSDGDSRDAEGDDRSGSEPLPRTREHAPSYGGAGGQPRTGSQEREPADSRGDADAEPPANPS